MPSRSSGVRTNRLPSRQPRRLFISAVILVLSHGTVSSVVIRDQDLAMARAAGIGVVVGYTGGWRRPPQLRGFDALVADWNTVTLRASP